MATLILCASKPIQILNEVLTRLLVGWWSSEKARKESSPMKWQTTFYFVLLSSVLAAGQLAPAAAEPAGDEYRLPRAAVDTQIANNGNGKIRGHGKGNKFKTNNLFGTKINYANGGPPPWAPAHGYRHKYATNSGGYKPPFGLDPCSP